MATKTKKKSSTTAKIKELTGVKPEKITDKQLETIQSTVSKINQTQMEIGQLETRKHQALHFLAGVNDELILIQGELEKDYGTNDINILDGIINYPENGEADKKD